MSFQTIPFLLFLCIVLAVLAITKSERARQYELLAASIIFYASWDIKFLVLIALCAAIVHAAGRAILKNKRTGGCRIKFPFVISIVLLLTVLGIFKYLKFFVSGFCTLFGIQNSPVLSIILPVGISFYVFSCIGYLIDIYRGEIADPVPFYQEALYIAFFPKLLQGPFQKATDFYRQLAREHPITLADISDGMQIFLFGLIKKVVIADRLGLFVDAVYAKPGVYSGATLLLAAVTYPMQLYCDFSGYSDMAVGTAKMLGYELPRNFNLPFLSRTVAEYWRRWHMSLNEWFRDYLFYPIVRSGWVNKVRKRTKSCSKQLARIISSMIGTAIVWPLVGLWHGTSWNFILYGCLYGLLMIAGLVGDTYRKGKNEAFDVLRVIRTWGITIFAMILFRAADLGTVGVVLKGIFTWQKGISYIYTWSLIYIPIVMLACVYAYKKNDGNGYYIQLDMGLFRNKVMFCTTALLMVILMYVGENYFMYFQF